LSQAFYDAQWALSSAKKGQLLDREVYRLKPLAAPAPTGGAKRKYLRCAARARRGPAARFETAAHATRAAGTPRRTTTRCAPSWRRGPR